MGSARFVKGRVVRMVGTGVVLVPLLLSSEGTDAGEARRYTAEVLPLFSKPFEGDYQIDGFFTHDPQQVGDKRQLTFWDSVTWGAPGHRAYDFTMKSGRPLLAMADGVVLEAGDRGPKGCKGGPAKKAITVKLRHDAPNGEIFTANYLHLSEALVEVGDAVTRGQVIGRSGATGCASGSHLHLGIVRVTNRRKMTGPKVDPFGWDGDRPDPLLLAEGSPSVWLWREGEAPLVFRDIPIPDPPRDGLGVSGMVGTAYKDHVHPNNEYVELALGPEAPGGRRDLSGVRIRNNQGDTYTFPDGTTLVPDQPIRLYSGPGQDTPRTTFWSRSTGAWDDNGDCVWVLGPDDEVLATQHWGRKKELWCGHDKRRW